ncbi:HD domain-containing phosphohydrolase [Oceanispirochaeta crateris]|nr:HD domain-containing phosphohydrolase [Oceanispirochaeta crateris]
MDTGKTAEKGSISIRTITDRLFFLLIVTILITLITVILFTSWIYYISSIENQYNSSITAINSLISSLYTAQQQQDSDEIDQNYKQIMDIIRDSPEILKRDLSPHDEILNNTDPETQYDLYLDQIRISIGILRKNHSQIQNVYKKGFPYFVVSILFLMVVMLLNLLKWKERQNQFFNEIQDGLQHVREVQLFNRNESFHNNHSYIEESQAFISEVSKILENLIMDRSLQNIEIHGNLEALMKELFFAIRKKTNCDRVALAFINGDNEITAETFYSNYSNLYLAPGHSEPMKNTSLGEYTHSGELRYIPDLEEYSDKKLEKTGFPVSESTRLILKEGIKSSLTIPFFVNDRCVGFLFISSRSKNSFDGISIKHAKHIFTIIKSRIYLEYIIQDIIARISQSFVTLMDKKDNETSSHIKRVSHYSAIIGRAVARKSDVLTPKDIREIYSYAPLHDIGKIGIPDSILLKPGSLTKDQFEIMNTHVTIGEEVIEAISQNISSYFPIPVLATAIDIIRGHHEKYDGSGYPRGLKGKEIPIAGRIVAIADVFDALTSKRPYKEAYSIEESLEIMTKKMTGHFDSDLLESFKDSIEDVKMIYEKYQEN